MIKRYTRPEMGKIWSEQAKFDNWLAVELAVLRAHEKITPGIPAGCADSIQAGCAGRLSANRIEQIEAEVHHDVIAFTTHVAELAGEPARYFHLGLTSSDILDTALALTINQAGDIIIDGIVNLLAVLKEKSLYYAHLPIMGRTHGIHAEPTTLGLKLALCWDEINRVAGRFASAIVNAAVGKISGAVGNYSQIDPEIERIVGELLELPMASISSQIVTRDRLASLLCTMAVLAGSIERLTTEVRLLQHTEIGELAEPFAKGQKGSSAMPHKRNPIISERMSGLARLMRSYVQVALENQNLWHERDISHSSAERVILPDAFCALDYMLAKTHWLIKGLDVDEERINANLRLSHEIYYSQSILVYLVEKGVSREEAYQIVQKASFRANEEHRSLRDTINEELTQPIAKTDLEKIFTMDRFTKHADEIMARLWTE